MPRSESPTAATTTAAPALDKLSLEELAAKLGSSPQGLTQEEAQRRLGEYGYNEIIERKTSPVLKFLGYFWGPIPWMIEGAIVLSAIVRHWADFFIILVLLAANAVVGFWEEYQADNAIAALKAKLAIRARALRDRKWVNPPARDIVPGDVIRLRLGDIVPADARLLEGDAIEVDQAALTGESLPVEREPGQTVYSGSIVRRGEIGALVYGTGTNTYFGKTAQLVQEAHTVSHFQRAVLSIGNYLIVLAVALVVLIVAVALYHGDPMLTDAPGKQPVLLFALVLTVAAIPVAMPTVLSVTMAVGARLLAKKEAVVSRLAAIEELAGVDVLCSDKTGTLTENKLTLGEPFCTAGVSAEQLILAAALASRAEDNDTIDLTVLGGLKDAAALESFQAVHFQPFDPVSKRTEATVKNSDGATFKVTKGAPQVILQLAANLTEVQAAAEAAIDQFANRGYRSLGVARTDEAGGWQFLGILPLFDPPRADARATIATARATGRERENGDGGPGGDCPGNGCQTGVGKQHFGCQRFRRREGPGDGATGRVYRSGRRLRPGLSRAQVSHCRRAAAARAYRGHDRRRRERCARAQEGRLRNRRLRCDRRGTGGRRHRALDRRAVDHHRRGEGEPQDLSADEQLRHLPHRGDDSRAVVHDALDPGVQLLSGDGADDRAVGAAQRRRDPVDRLRQRSVLEQAGSVEHARRARGVDDAGRDRGGGVVRPVLPGRARVPLDREFIQTLMYLKLSVAGHLTIFVTRTRGPFWSRRPAPILLGAVLGTQILATVIAAMRSVDDADRLGLGAVRLGLRAGLVSGQRSGEAAGLPNLRSQRATAAGHGGEPRLCRGLITVWSCPRCGRRRRRGSTGGRSPSPCGGR